MRQAAATWPIAATSIQLRTSPHILIMDNNNNPLGVWNRPVLGDGGVGASRRIIASTARDVSERAHTAPVTRLRPHLPWSPSESSSSLSGEAFQQQRCTAVFLLRVHFNNIHVLCTRYDVIVRRTTVRREPIRSRPDVKHRAVCGTGLLPRVCSGARVETVNQTECTT